MFVLSSHMQYHNDTINKQTQEDFLRKIYTSHFIVRVRKGYSRFYCERELETEHNCNILTPTLMAVSVVSFSFSRAAQPEAQRPTLLGDGFLYCILSATLLDPNSSGPQGLFALMWLSLPHLVYNSVSNCNCNCLTSVLTELYNSSTPTQSPTRSLEWHVGSSSSRNNCHAVHRSLSSGASVYECTKGIFFTPSHFISQFPSTRFPLITAIRMCHFLPVHHSEWHFWPGRRSKYHIWLLVGRIKQGKC